MGEREVAAPGLREVAEVWWDLDEDPVVRWDADGRHYVLAAASGDDRLLLATVASPPDDAAVLARVLAEGLASCDFPPTGEGAAPGRVRATLAAAGRDDVLVEPPTA